MRGWIFGAVLWVAAFAVTGAGMAFAPGEQCGDDNKATWVAAANRAGTLFAIAAVLALAATPFLIYEAVERQGRRRYAFALLSVLSVGAMLFLALAAFLNLVFQCLE